jgi:hypothetical protein
LGRPAPCAKPEDTFHGIECRLDQVVQIHTSLAFRACGVRNSTKTEKRPVQGPRPVSLIAARTAPSKQLPTPTSSSPACRSHPARAGPQHSRQMMTRCAAHERKVTALQRVAPRCAEPLAACKCSAQADDRPLACKISIECLDALLGERVASFQLPGGFAGPIGVIVSGRAVRGARWMTFDWGIARHLCRPSLAGIWCPVRLVNDPLECGESLGVGGAHRLLDGPARPDRPDPPGAGKGKVARADRSGVQGGKPG